MQILKVGLQPSGAATRQTNTRHELFGPFWIYEVGVDAQTGTILENKKEGPHPD